MTYTVYLSRPGSFAIGRIVARNTAAKIAKVDQGIPAEEEPVLREGSKPEGGPPDPESGREGGVPAVFFVPSVSPLSVPGGVKEEKSKLFPSVPALSGGVKEEPSGGEKEPKPKPPLPGMDGIPLPEPLPPGMEGIPPPGPPPFPGPPPPVFITPMSDRVREPASTRAELSARCPSEVEGIVPSSCPRMLSPRMAQ